MLKTDSEISNSQVTCQTGQGVEIHATLLHLTRYLAVFEIYNPDLALRTSEVLGDFRIVLNGRVVYSGRAVVGSLVNTGLLLVCEVALEEQSWADVELTPGPTGREKLRGEFNEFIQEWQKLYLVSRDYKVVIADIESFLAGLRLWLDQAELNIRASPAAKRAEMELEVVQGLRDSVTQPVSSLFERFEEVSDKIQEDLRPAHRTFGQRRLHPLLLCAPFIYRCYSKPLGYAGDYEMMNMIIRNGYEGSSLYAKLVNAYLLDQGPAHAVRNRVDYLTNRIIEETARISREGRTAKIYNVACGPAREVERFVAEHPLADGAHFRLLDFSEETLRCASDRVNEAKWKHHRNTGIEIVKNSVQALIKSQSKGAPMEQRYDLIYSSGLYDYLNDPICKRLNALFYDQLRPGGLLVVGNFGPSTSIRNVMEHLLEWFLIYRGPHQMMSLIPYQAAPEHCFVRAESTGSNMFLEVRKPA